VSVDAAAAVPRPPRAIPGWLPLALMTVLMFGVGAYAAASTSDFLSSFNLNTLLGSSGVLPLALVAMGQTNALMVRGFDVSVGALMTLVVVVGSKGLLTSSSWYWLLLGSLGLIAMAVAAGLLNAFLIRKVGLPSIIATLATLSIMQGISLDLRPFPDGPISQEFADALNTSVSFIPLAFIGVVVLAVLWDLWLYMTPGGLTSRAVGLDEDSSRRLGAPSERINWRAFVLCSLMAGIAGLFLAAQVGIGDARVGSGYALTSIAAAVLGGASLMGGKGSFIGAVVGALFLSLIINILPLPNIVPSFLREWTGALGYISIGVLTLLALVLYQAPELWTRARTAWSDVRRSRPQVRGEASP
jgi:ribose transport system ATP-binding protein